MEGFVYAAIAWLITILYSSVSVLAPVTGHTIETKNGDNTELCFSVISDIHIGLDTDRMAPRKVTLEQGFKDMSVDAVDAVVIPGDITDNGYPEQYEIVYGIAKDNLCGPKLITSLGNHDHYTEKDGSADPDTTAAFRDAYNKYSGENYEHAYYSTTVNGYTFICLASEKSGIAAYISDEQMQWFDEELAKATADGLPVFVVSHWPINGTVGQPIFWEEGGLGEQSDAVEAIMNKYENVFYFSGHTHIGLRNSLVKKMSGQTIEKRGNVWHINMPTFVLNNYDGFLTGHPSYFQHGCGFVVEVTDSKVQFRARNFALRYWIPSFDSTVSLENSELISVPLC